MSKLPTDVPPATDADFPPVIASRYAVLRPLGRGGLGDVLLVADRARADAPRALKLLRPDLDPAHIASLRHEFLSLTQLDHPNIARVHDFGYDPELRSGDRRGQYFFTASYIDGEDLAHAAYGREIETVLVPYLVEVCEALAYLHTHGFLHGDLKPSNVVIRQAQPPLAPGEQSGAPGATGAATPALGDAVLIDFGLLRPVGLHGDGATSGTPQFLAPECFAGTQVDARADLYALGVCCYYLCTGALPFSGETIEKLAHGHQHVPSPPLPELGAGGPIPEWFRQLAFRLISKDVDERPNSAGEVRQCLLSRTATPGLSVRSPDAPVEDAAFAPALTGPFVGRQAFVERLAELVPGLRLPEEFYDGDGDGDGAAEEAYDAEFVSLGPPDTGADDYRTDGPPGAEIPDAEPVSEVSAALEAEAAPVALVIGPAGSGKRRTLAEFRAFAQVAGAAVFHVPESAGVVAEEAARPHALGTLHEILLLAGVIEESAPELETLVRRLAKPHAAAAADAARVPAAAPVRRDAVAVLADAIVEALAGFARSRPTMLLVERVDRLGPTSRSLIEAIAQRLQVLPPRGASQRPALIGTAESDQHRPTPASVGLTDAAWTALAVPTFTSDEALDLAATVLGLDDIPERYSRWLVEHADGRPQTVLEMLGALRDSQRLRYRAGRWHFAGEFEPLAWTAPSVESRYEARIDGVSREFPAAIDVLALLAWRGAPLEVATIARVLPQAVPATTDRLRDRGLVLEQRAEAPSESRLPTTLSLARAVVGSLALGKLEAARGAVLGSALLAELRAAKAPDDSRARARLAEAIAALADGPAAAGESLATRASLWAAAGDAWHEIPEAPQETVDAYTRATALAPDSIDASTRGDWLLASCSALQRAQRIPEAQAVLAEVRAAFQTRSAADRLKVALIEHGLCMDIGDWEGATAANERADALAREVGDRRAQCQCAYNRGVVRYSGYDLEVAVVALAEAEALARELDDDEQLALALGQRANICFSAGRSKEGLPLALEARALWVGLGNEARIAITDSNLGLLHANLGDWDRALTYYEGAESTYRRLGMLSPLSHLLNNLTHVHLERGEHGRALDCQLEGLRLSDLTGERPVHTIFDTNVAELVLRRGQIARARKHLERASENLAVVSEALGEAAHVLVWSHFYRCTGKTALALRYCRRAYRRFIKVQFTQTAVTAACYAGFIVLQGNADTRTAARWLARAEALTVDPNNVEARTWISLLRGWLALAQGDWAKAGAVLTALADSLDTRWTRYEECVALPYIARFFWLVGERERFERARTRLRKTLATAPGPRTDAELDLLTALAALDAADPTRAQKTLERARLAAVSAEAGDLRAEIAAVEALATLHLGERLAGPPVDVSEHRPTLFSWLVSCATRVGWWLGGAPLNPIVPWPRRLPLAEELAPLATSDPGAISEAELARVCAYAERLGFPALVWRLQALQGIVAGDPDAPALLAAHEALVADAEAVGKEHSGRYWAPRDRSAVLQARQGTLPRTPLTEPRSPAPAEPHSPAQADALADLPTVVEPRPSGMPQRPAAPARQSPPAGIPEAEPLAAGRLTPPAFVAPSRLPSPGTLARLDTERPLLSADALEVFETQPALVPAARVGDRALSAVLTDLARAREPEAVARVILDYALDTTEAERGFVFLVNAPDAGAARREGSGSASGERPDVLAPRFATAIGRTREGETIRRASERVSHRLLEQVLASGAVIVATDAQRAERLAAWESLSALSVRSVCAIPLVGDAGALGVVLLDHRHLTGVFTRGVADRLALLSYPAGLALEQHRLRRELAALGAEVDELRAGAAVDLPRPTTLPAGGFARFPEIVTRSAAMAGVFDLMVAGARADVPVLLTGESGTGKELVARAIHRESSRGRRTATFQSVNCGALPESLLEVELFGAVKGAYTGLDRAKPGLFELADGGTLMLDEVAEMPPRMQQMLLRVLVDGEVRRLGGSNTRHVDVRVVAAGNRDLTELVAAGTFRQDLYYRLKVLEIVLPPLRERTDDVPLLLEHFLRLHGDPPQLAQKVFDELMNHSWPGNVRELQNVATRIALLARPGEPFAGPLDLGSATFLAAAGALPPLDDLIASLTSTHVRRALDLAHGNKAEAARQLGIERTRLLRLIKKYGIATDGASR